MTSVSLIIAPPQKALGGCYGREERKKIKEPEDREVCSEMLSFGYAPADTAMNTQPLQTSSLARTIQLPVVGDGEPVRSQSFLGCSRLPMVPGGERLPFSLMG